ncbi:MAG: hypothetical protein A2270_09955 [Elusimicrobia bacterium RIFOXYA12_FULL_51_18]|nr:MAG: hypothetical protein A2270_09955 [Elusimicrobia bacterium RIFOXYA12_FULL_51_18]OGS32390.1 MAG: hypothetical protein A2218_02185 [Elusimicrobia bacterium RIFOXYA2_FULL_53_38]
MAILLKTSTLSILYFFISTAPLSAGTAILWIPREHAPLDDVIARLEKDKSLKLSAAPGEIPSQSMEKIKGLAAEGRIELAARPDGDPIIPLFYYPREDAVQWRNKPSSAAFTNDPFFIALRMSDARDAHTRNFTHPPDGLVSAPGGTISEYIPLAKALGFKWLAAGPLTSTGPFSFINAEGVSIVPFSLPPAYGETAVTRLPDCPASQLPGYPAAQPYFLVFDETSDGPGYDSRAALLSFLSTEHSSPYMTVSEAIKIAVSTALPPSLATQITAPWSGDYSSWAGAPMQSGALTAFTRTRSELMAHLNSKQGDYKAAKAAFTEYFSVESGPKLLKLSDPDPEAAKETEIELQNALANTYRLMDKTPPGWLFSTLADMKEETEDSDKLTVTKSSDGLIFINATRAPLPPAGVKAYPKNQNPQKIWKLAKMDISWTDNDIIFVFSPSAPPETVLDGTFSGARFDLYIDINNRPRAGSTKLLDYRAGRIFPDNAWEYALGTSAKKASLYTATTKGPREIGTFKPGFENGSFTVRVPRTSLPGNPGLWSYTAFMLYTTDDKTFEITDFLAEDFSNGYYYAARGR